MPADSHIPQPSETAYSVVGGRLHTVRVAAVTMRSRTCPRGTSVADLNPEVHPQTHPETGPVPQEAGEGSCSALFVRWKRESGIGALCTSGDLYGILHLGMPVGGIACP